MQLDIVDEEIVDKAGGESISVTNGGQTLTFNVNLANPGDSKTIKFKIENVGSTDAELGTLSISAPEDPAVDVTWPSLDEVTVDAGDKTGYYEIVVTWDSNYASAEAGSVTFSATINYAEYVGE